MVVSCGHCGRDYDVSLFELGRTIWCTCGARVGLEPRVRSAQPGAPKRFVADSMLGGLARWLRLLGFDCAWDEHCGDDALVRLALDEGRIVLTRDRRLPEEWWIEDIYVVVARHPDAQLEEVVARFDLASEMRPLTRCALCNARTAPIAAAMVVDRVPARVRADHDAFTHCQGCGRVYWEGSHAARIRRRAEALARRPPPRGSGLRGAG